MRGEGGWGQHLLYSKYYPKKFNKKGEPFTKVQKIKRGWGQHLLHSKSSTTTKNGMENKMTKKGEGGWGQHLCHSKYYKFKRVWGSISITQNIIPKSSTKRGNLSQMHWREKGAGGSISSTQKSSTTKKASFTNRGA